MALDQEPYRFFPAVQAHEEFWSRREVVREWESKPPGLFGYEYYLLKSCVELGRERFGSVRLTHVIGCGGGWQLPAVCKALPESRVIASDISARMIEACQANLREWGCGQKVSFQTAAAHQLRSDEQGDLVLVFNNVLTYLTPLAARQQTVEAIRALLRPGGLLAGVVHSRYGRVLKTCYFVARFLACKVLPFLGDPGDRIAGHGERRYPAHYYTRGELRVLLEKAGLKPILLMSLSSLARSLGRPLSPLKTDNNLIFLAEAR